MHFIYLITNLVNGKIYIGQAKKLLARWSNHKYMASRFGKRSRQPITRAIAKYGLSNFKFEHIASSLTQEDVNIAEVEIIAQYNSTNPSIGYNISPGGSVFPATKEMILRRSDSLRKYYKNGGRHPFKGKKLSESHKRAISESSFGKKGTNKGKSFSSDWREKISKSSTKGKESLRRFSSSTELEICEKYLNKISAHQLAKDYGCYRNVIIAVLIRNNISIRSINKTPNGRNKFTKSQEKEICNIYLNETCNRSEIARRYGVRTNTITGILFRGGILKGGRGE